MDNKYLSSTHGYNDVSGLQKLRTGAKNNDDKALEAVAKQLEGVFLNMMLKSMREANSMFGEDNPLNSKETEFYQGMYDQQISLSMAEGKGIGLADVIIRQMRGVGGDSQKIDELLEKNQAKGEAREAGFPLNNETVGEKSGFPLNIQQQGLPLPEKKTEYLLPLERVRSVAWGNNLARNTDVKPNTITASLNASAISTPSDVTGQNNIVATNAAENSTVATSSQYAAPSQESSPLESALRHTFPTAAAFVDVITPYAKAAANELGIDVNAIVAQAALETGWGNHIIKGSDGKPSLNLFGIKSNPNWTGDSTTVKTLEYKDGIAAKETADFRSYKSMDEAFQDYISFLKNNPRYKHALENTNTAKDWGFQLQQAGYATDPNYGKKIASIVSRLSSSDKN
ncbi:MAG: flagellar assembly peptidoglycan hydrolase FlgJ [Pseudomonadales bacterium]|nr:flagellar assembly peptidoglycan hydrolase FlgJ [Pseudomonadales bacterium]